MKRTIKVTNLNEMLRFIILQTPRFKSRAEQKFNEYRYAENYEACIKMATDLGARII